MIKYFTTVFHIFVKTTIDKFMEYIPPCKGCIIQSMCLETNNDHTNNPFIITRKCNILNKYLEQNNSFVIIKRGTALWHELVIKYYDKEDEE